MAKREQKKHVKLEKFANHLMSVSSKDSISVHPELMELEFMDSEESDVGTSKMKSVVKVLEWQELLAPWDTDAESPPKKRPRMESP